MVSLLGAQPTGGIHLFEALEPACFSRLGNHATLIEIVGSLDAHCVSLLAGEASKGACDSRGAEPSPSQENRPKHAQVDVHRFGGLADYCSHRRRSCVEALELGEEEIAALSQEPGSDHHLWRSSSPLCAVVLVVRADTVRLQLGHINALAICSTAVCKCSKEVLAGPDTCPQHSP